MKQIQISAKHQINRKVKSQGKADLITIKPEELFQICQVKRTCNPIPNTPADLEIYQAERIDNQIPDTPADLEIYQAERIYNRIPSTPADLVSSIIKYLKQLNAAGNVQYETDYTISNPGFNHTDYIKQIKDNTEFTYTLSPEEKYEYEGNNPAEALKKLIQHKPLLLDCRLAKDLSILLAICNQVGSTQFNQMIKALCNNKLNINFECCQKLLGNKLTLTDYVEETLSGKDNFDNLKDITIGTIIYIMIPQAVVVHPCSDYNGYHLICVGMDKDNKPLFLGFSNSEQSPKPIADFIKILKDNLNRNLSYKDFLYIANQAKQSNRKPIDFTKYNYCDYYNRYIFNNKSDFIRAIMHLKTRIRDKS